MNGSNPWNSSIIFSFQAVLRALYAYFADRPLKEVPHIEVFCGLIFLPQLCHLMVLFRLGSCLLELHWLKHELIKCILNVFTGSITSLIFKITWWLDSLMNELRPNQSGASEFDHFQIDSALNTFGELWFMNVKWTSLTWDLSFSDASSYHNRDTNGSYRCCRKKVQTNGLKLIDEKLCY